MPMIKQARLRVRLKGFQKPDTGSDFEGYAEVGPTYTVLDVRTVGGNDFALLEVPLLGAGDTWVCCKSGGVVYADVVEVERPAPAVRQSFVGVPNAIDEAALTALFADFKGYTYDHHDAYYPWALPGIAVPQGTKQNNCCTFVEALVVKAFANALGAGFAWDMARHRQMMIIGDDRYSPVTAVVESGIAIPAPSADAPPHPWSVVQGWRSERMDGGHTFLIVDHDAASDRVLMLESNCAYGLNGPGYRFFGALEKFGTKAPDNWQNNPNCWTWQFVRSTYVLRQQAVLKVKNRTLSGLPS